MGCVLSEFSPRSTKFDGVDVVVLCENGVSEFVREELGSPNDETDCPLILNSDFPVVGRDVVDLMMLAVEVRSPGGSSEGEKEVWSSC